MKTVGRKEEKAAKETKEEQPWEERKPRERAVLDQIKEACLGEGRSHPVHCFN